MADSWEDQADEEIVMKPAANSNAPPAGGPSLNPNAASFSFNPNAQPFSFVPGGAPPPPPPAAAAAPPPPPAAAPAAPAPPPPAPAPAPAAPAPPPPQPKEPEPAAPPPAPKAQEPPVKEVAAMSVKEEVKPKKASKPELEEEDDKYDTSKVDAILKQINGEDARDHMNIVFIGHVDAGKSTTGGSILLLTGGVDERTIQKYEKEAKEKNRESWYMAYIMDTNEEERAKGKTVEVGRAHFETEKRRYTILDAPGHKNYVPNMIGGAAQADIGVLIIAARKGEFETGFERGGQTREHAQLAKTLGVAKLIVAINKMDDPSICPDGVWSKDRYEDLEKRLTPFLKQCGYQKKDVQFIPISGLKGTNINISLDARRDRVESAVCPWYNGPSLFEILDEIEPQNRDPHAPFRMSIIDKYRDMGTVVMGKSESGVVKTGDKLIMMPNKQICKVVNIYRDDVEASAARPGENLLLRLSGIEEEEVSSGMVLGCKDTPVPVCHTFETQLAILELLEHKPILSAGYKAVIHIHSLIEECEIVKLVAVLDVKTKEKKKAKFVKSGNIAFVRIRTDKPVCMETFDKVPQLGRFTLRDEGRTIAIGKVIKLPDKRVKEGKA